MYPGWQLFTFDFPFIFHSKNSEFPTCIFFIFYIYMIAGFAAKFKRLKIELPVMYYFIE